MKIVSKFSLDLAHSISAASLLVLFFGPGLLVNVKCFQLEKALAGLSLLLCERQRRHMGALMVLPWALFMHTNGTNQSQRPKALTLSNQAKNDVSKCKKSATSSKSCKLTLISFPLFFYTQLSSFQWPALFRGNMPARPKNNCT